MNEFSTIAALRAADPTQVTAAQRVTTDGYYALGDGGGATFLQLYSAPNAQGSDTRPVDDGGSVIRSATTGYYYQRLAGGPVAFRSFGAKGDLKAVAAGLTISADSKQLIYNQESFVAGDVGKYITIPGAGGQGASSVNTWYTSGGSAIAASSTANGQTFNSGNGAQLGNGKYATGDRVTLAGGTLAANGFATILVLQSNGKWTTQRAGSYSTTPSNPVSVGSTTSLSGSGGSFNLTYAVGPLLTTIAQVTNAYTAVLTDAAVTSLAPTQTQPTVSMLYGTDDTAAFQAMASYANSIGGGVEFRGRAGNVHLFWPQYKYPYDIKLPALIQLNGVASRWLFNGSQFYTDNSFAPNDYSLVFFLNETSQFFCDGFDLTCPNYNFTDFINDDVEGAVGFYLYGACFRTHIINAKQQGGRHFLRVEVLSTTTTQSPYYAQAFYLATARRAKGILVDNAITDRVYYPYNFEGTGDNFTGTNLIATNSGRAYFAYNVRQHDVDLTSNHGGEFMDVLLKCYCASSQGSTTAKPVPDLDSANQPFNASYNVLSDIELRYTNLGRATGNPSQAWIAIEFEQVSTTSTPGTIKNIHVELDVEVTSTGMPGDNSPTGQNGGAGLLTYKFLSADTPNYEATDNAANNGATRGYTLENIEFTGSVTGADYGQGIVDLFNPSNGLWTGETIRNIRFRDFTIDGQQSSFKLDGAGVQAGLIFDNVHGTVPVTVSNALVDTVEVRNCGATGLSGLVNVVAGSKSIVIPLDKGWRKYLIEFDNLFTGSDQETLNVFFSTNGGSSFISGTGLYNWFMEEVTSGNPPATTSGTASLPIVIAGIGGSGGDNAGFNGYMEIYPGPFGNGAQSPRMESRLYGRTNSGALMSIFDMYGYLTQSGITQINALVIVPAKGPWSAGQFQVKKG